MVLCESYHIQIFIMQSTRPYRYWWFRLAIDGTKMSSTGFIDFSNYDTSNILNLSNPTVNLSLASQTKCNDMFLDPELDHMFSYFLGYIPGLYIFLLVCGNYPLTLKRGRCRNLLSIYSRLNQINPSTNIIFLPNVERGYITKL